MSKLQNFLKTQADGMNPDTWWKYECSNASVEATASKYINEEPTKELQPLARILASSSPTISDAYRFDNAFISNYEIYTDMVSNYRSKAPFILYRGASSVPFECMVNAANDLQETNVDFYEKGFLSCSLLPEYATKVNGRKQFKIFCMPGTNMIYLGHINDAEEPNQQCRYEVVVQRGAKLQLLREDSDYYYCLLRSTI